MLGTLVFGAVIIAVGFAMPDASLIQTFTLALGGGMCGASVMTMVMQR